MKKENLCGDFFSFSRFEKMDFFQKKFQRIFSPKDSRVWVLYTFVLCFVQENEAKRNDLKFERFVL